MRVGEEELHHQEVLATLRAAVAVPVKLGLLDLRVLQAGMDDQGGCFFSWVK
jgi:hypothetical protein